MCWFYLILAFGIVIVSQTKSIWETLLHTYNRTTKIKFKKFKTSLRISPQNRSHIRKCLTRQSLVNYNKCFFYTYVTYVIQDGQTGILYYIILLYYKLYYVLRLSEFVPQIGPTDLPYSNVRKTFWSLVSANK